MARRIRLAGLAAGALALVGACGPPANTTLPRGTSTSHGDYAVEVWGDPWDYANTEDWDPLARALTASRGMNATMAGGAIRWKEQVGGGVIVAASHFDQLEWGRSLALGPLDTATYRSASIGLTSSTDGQGYLMWYSCPQILPSCEGQVRFPVRAGTHTYVLDLAGAPPSGGGNVAWLGQVPKALRVVGPMAQAADVRLEFLRFLRPGAPAEPSAGPIPVVLDPARSRGPDGVAAVRGGDAWDFSQPSDLRATSNLTDVSIADGLLRACNTTNDPSVELPLPAPIDGNTSYRVRIRVHYDGPFSLENRPGGGMNARLYWRVAGAPATAGGWQPSNDIIVFPGWNDIDLDLSTIPATRVNEPGGVNATGWVGQQIVALRFDPHEDPGRRCFLLDRVDLLGAQQQPVVRFRDDARGTGAPAAGSVARVGLDNDLAGFDGTVVADKVPVRAGTNEVGFDRAAVGDGYWWPWVSITDPAGRTTTRYASAPIRIG